MTSHPFSDPSVESSVSTVLTQGSQALKKARTVRYMPSIKQNSSFDYSSPPNRPYVSRHLNL